MAIRWVSNPESIKANQPSVLAIAETLAAMGVSVWIAVTWDTYVHIAIGALIAPLLLMRTDESCIRGYDLAPKFFKLSHWFASKAIEASGYRKRILNVVWGLQMLLWVPTHLLVARLAASVATAVRHPLDALVAVPGNWWYTIVVLDSAKWPDVLPVPRKLPGSVDPDIRYDVGRSIKHLHVGRIIKILREYPDSTGARLGWWLAVPTLPLIIVPAFAYRWSLKSTAIIWFPLLWAMRSVREAGKPLRAYLSIYLRDPITAIVLWVSIAAIIGLAAKIALFNEWAGFVDSWNATPLRRVLSLYIAPAEIQWWQVAMAINSAIAIVMYILARRWLVRIEHDELSDESMPRRVFRVGLFIRPILSCYTIACTLYITIRAASDWDLPALGSRPFPWM